MQLISCPNCGVVLDFDVIIWECPICGYEIKAENTYEDMAVNLSSNQAANGLER
jgi:DNA-directed RNA polymerase subunit M/transcription elongation factor TFIIS